ncbi:cysteine hydrolase [Labrys okinawensis]|uniref:Cysteine hydrolase n=1 Tax=Labrys okinawensis TaxID=346911 RepID=A0A2S9Q858_9HYPH|nr:isochorismatase family cysteine hydrolase [Labrys okinawensis]PRH85543.1 cysteine hydrolase [Labrys okinawensis]
MSVTSSSIHLDATPAAICFEPAKSAVIVVDMQNDFCSKGGMFDLAGHDIGLARDTIAPIARLLAGARRAGMHVVYLVHGFLPDLSDAGGPRSRNWLLNKDLNIGKEILAPDGSKGRIHIRNTWNTGVVDELKPEPADLVVYKNRFSGFYATDLDEQLRALGIDTLFFAGTTTSVCVESTLRDASFRDYTAVLLADCMGEALGEEFHVASQKVIAARLGWVSQSADLVKQLQRRDAARREAAA